MSATATQPATAVDPDAAYWAQYGWIAGAGHWLEAGATYHAVRCPDLEARNPAGDRLTLPGLPPLDRAAGWLVGRWSRCGLELDVWAADTGVDRTRAIIGRTELLDLFARPCRRCYPEAAE